MDVFEGFITDKKVAEDYIVFDTFGHLGFLYSTYRDSEPKVYLKKQPSFEEIYNCFMKYKIGLLKMNKTQDICLSLFYNPFFTEFYEKIKANVNGISTNRLNFLKNNMLKYLADDTQYEIIVKRNMKFISPWLRNYYIEKDIYNKSKELLELMSKVK